MVLSYLRRNRKQAKGNNKKKTSPKANASSPVINKEIVTTSGEKRKVVVKAASNEDLSVSKVPSGQLTYPALKVEGGTITEALNKQLQYPEAFYTYSEMLSDTTVASALNLKKSYLWIALSKFSVKAGNPNSKKSRDAAAFVEWCFKNMNQTWYDVCNNMLSYNKWGFSAMEKVFTKVKSGKHKGKLKIEKLSPISPKSIDEWVFDENNQSLLGIVQSTEYLDMTSKTFSGLRISSISDKKTKADIDVPRSKFTLWSYRSEISNPVGESPLADCYTPFQALRMIQDYQLVGISKNLGGVIEVGLPAEVLAKANADPSSSEAMFVNDMAEQAANAHAGDQTYFMLPTDMYQTTQQRMYSLTLKGIEGTTNSMDLDSTIGRYQKDILDSFGVGFIKTGQVGNAGYNLHESQTSTHGLMLQSDLAFLEEPINGDIIPQLLALNGVRLDSEDMPVFKAGDIDEEDKEVFSKVFQRLGATGFISKHPLVIRNIMKRSGVPDEIMSLIPDEELLKYLPEDTSRVGDGMKSGLPNGTGKNTGSRGNDSDNNSENAS